LDFFDTFSPVAKLVIVKVLLTLTTTNKWSLVQLDVNNVFLNGNLFEEEYMDLPLGYKPKVPAPNQGKQLVYKLHKSIYGLKQTSRKWFSKFYNALLTHGFHQSKLDYSSFTKGTSASFVAFLIYVDDIIITGSDLAAIAFLKVFLHGQFKLKDLGHLRYFLGPEIVQSAKGIFFSQRHYTLQLLEDTGFFSSKLAILPMIPNVKLSSFNGELLEDSSVYKHLVGRLLYLTIS